MELGCFRQCGRSWCQPSQITQSCIKLREIRCGRRFTQRECLLHGVGRVRNVEDQGLVVEVSEVVIMVEFFRAEAFNDVEAGGTGGRGLHLLEEEADR